MPLERQKERKRQGRRPGLRGTLYSTLLHLIVSLLFLLVTGATFISALIAAVVGKRGCVDDSQVAKSSLTNSLNMDSICNAALQFRFQCFHISLNAIECENMKSSFCVPRLAHKRV